MKTIERRFLAVRKRNVNLGDYPTLYKAVKCAEFKETTISKWFSILVSKDEYDLQDRRQLVKQLTEASSTTLRTALLG
jgi:hypothetical protein